MASVSLGAQLTGKVTDLRKPVAAIAVLPGSSRCEQPKYFTWARKGGRPLFAALLPPEPPLSLVILARCLAGNQLSGPLREEEGGDVSLLGMRPLYFSDIQQEQHSHHL
ncbi:unnamed protein product [Pleuronectes platessa]|uniref:Uncharacterized protein n=1 Tax=Pleuronectes platessa TaxID=8262 RepID=A0A9N7TJA7_PLEPL|nr:unnamed protein product [Pleuronectes platessa]